MGKLYIVATPIGNIEDITLRAIRILKEVDLILCENVSESHRLLKHYEIKTATTNYYANSRLDKIDKIIEMLTDGKNLALISDAGTPCISDPGALLVQKIYEYNTNDNSIEVVSIPGTSAVTALYSASGVTGNSFAFYGFIPQKKGRQTFIKNIIKETKEKEIPIIFYESVHRFEKMIEQFASSLKEEILLTLKDEALLTLKDETFLKRYIFTIGREISKMHEQIVKGDILEIKSYFEINKDKVRGEFVVMVQYLNKNLNKINHL